MTDFRNTTLEYDAQCAVRSQRFKIQHCCAYSYLERSIHPLERIDITADQRIDLTAAYPIDKKRRVHLDFFFRHFLDPHIGDEATGARPGKFPMSMTALQSLHPSAQPSHIVIDDAQSFFRISTGDIGRRTLTTVVGKETQPFVETPLVQHGRLARDKIFHLAFKQ